MSTIDLLLTGAEAQSARPSTATHHHHHHCDDDTEARAQAQAKQTLVGDCFGIDQREASLIYTKAQRGLSDLYQSNPQLVFVLPVIREASLIYTKAIPNSCLFCLWAQAPESVVI